MAAVVNRKPLDKNLRTNLERLVIKARDIAENAAEQSLNRLAVGEAKAPEYLSDAERSLRNRLRAHGRQIGDILSENGQQTTRKLITEVAYEHWHRMLFARFLEQNNLLMYDQHTPVTIDDCNELIQEGVFQDELEAACSNGWELAGVLASKMLPQIFRTDSPVFELQFALELQRDLEKLVMSLEPEVFQAQDSLGWVYQFWQTKRKKEVNESEVKIGADELSPVTQLFTEPYMVSFLLDNALGAWWAGKRLSEVDWKTASSEQELREKASIPGVPLSYLRFVKEEDQWKPASGFFEAWPEHLSELKTLDPCCGSGHFLVAAFLMLVPIRMAREGLSAQAAVDAVLTENLHGLELDQRCVELAVFALALEAWRYPNTGGYRVLPELLLACSGLSVNISSADWLELAGNNRNLQLGLNALYKQFTNAPILGSLLNPRVSLGEDTLFEENWDHINNALIKALKNIDDREKVALRIFAMGTALVARLLSMKFHWLLTNVPFLGFKRQNDVLRNFCEQNYPLSQAGLETVFIERMLQLCKDGGVLSFVSNQTWLFQPSSKALRAKLLKNETFTLVARLGAGAFETITGEVVNVCLTNILSAKPITNTNLYLYDVQNRKSPSLKSQYLICEHGNKLNQLGILQTDGAIISSISGSVNKALSVVADAASGLKTGDRDRFNRFIWEVNLNSDDWQYYHTSSKIRAPYTGRSEVIFWQNDNGELSNLALSLKHLNHVVQNYKRGQSVWEGRGVAVSATGRIESSIYLGDRFDSGITVLVPRNNSVDVSALLAYCQSGTFEYDLRKIDSKLSITTSTTIKAPFDHKYWSKVAQEQYPKGLPQPYTNDPTQWIFHGHPCGSVVWDEEEKWTVEAEKRVDDTVLQVVVARLLGYQWPAELDSEMELAEEQRSWVEKSKDLQKFADDDGIVCLPAVRGEKSADIRLEEILEACYGKAWTINLKNQLLETVGSRSLTDWLRDKFFEQHCKLFQHRPFIWQIWDGLKDGFNVLLNYHKLDKLGLERLIYTYLGDWIRTQQAGVANGIDGADIRLAAAQSLKAELEKILEGEKPYDIFVRWKSLEDQPIGWNPDLNDGVRLNIRPFMLAKDMGKKGAGLLRAKPNINWNKDRGKDVSSAPWYSLGLEYGESEGARINEHHLCLAEKIAAQDEAKKS